MKIEIEVPKSLSDITLGKYQKYHKWESDNPNAKPVFKAQKMSEIFCGLDFKDSYNIKASEAFQLYETVNNILSYSPEVFAKSFEINGINFGMIKDFENTTIGEYADIDSNIADIKNWHRAFAVIFRPFVTDKEIEAYENTDKYCEIMQDISLEVVFGCMLFFWSSKSEYIQSIIHYLENSKEVQEVMKSYNLLKDTDGIPLTLHSLGELLKTYRVPPKFHFTRL